MATNPYQPKIDELIQGSQIQPVTQDFDESKGVAGRVQSIIQQDSPLMQQAATRAAQAANQRGLRNSSLAVQAGQQAVIDRATPIAQTDAQLFQQQALTNQGARNDTNRFNATTRTTTGLEGMGLMERARQFDESAKLDRAQMQQQERLAQATLANQRTIAKMDADSRLKLAEMEAGYRTEIAGNENIANAWGTMMQNISQVQNNPELGEAAKRTLIQNNIASFQSFTNFWNKVSGSVDVSDLLNFGTAAGPTGSQTTTAPTTRERAPTAPSGFPYSVLPGTPEQGYGFDLSGGA